MARFLLGTESGWLSEKNVFLEANAMCRRFLGLILLTALSVLPAQAGNLYLGLGLQGSRALDRSDIEGDGGGAELTLGYFFSPNFALELAGFISEFQNDRVEGILGAASVNARLSPFPKERLQPYLKAGVGAYFLEENYTDSGLAGPGANLGVGTELFLAPGLSIGAEATWRFIVFTDEYFDDGCDYYCDGPIYSDLPEDLDGTTFSGGLTLTYHFR